ncbi:MAG: VanZ family protein [Thiobacillus sp.]|nr:VanZ family protein [Thiobacillus sp.]
MIQRLWWACAWLGVCITLLVSLMPPPFKEGGAHTDKIVHLAGYAVLMFWWAQLILQRRWRLALAVVLLGIAIEWLQGFTPNRQTDALDVLANSGGVLLGWLAARLSPNLPQRIGVLFASRR